jgi:hypothetical protein
VKRVIIESPYAGDTKRNGRYLRACIKDSLLRGESPFASHALYTHALDDDKPDERRQGIAAGYVWRHVADATVIYADLGWSAGMIDGSEHARSIGQDVEVRTIGKGWDRA